MRKNWMECYGATANEYLATDDDFDDEPKGKKAKWDDIVK